jgi:tRNA(Ile)-lysidine synthase
VDAIQHMVEHVRRALARRERTEPGMVVAVSGGPDSIALLRALVLARGPSHSPSLVVAHLNHRLRGHESDADEAFVSATFNGLHASGAANLTLCCASIDIAAEAQRSGMNVEAAGRDVRYRWLAEVAQGHGMHWVATGHTANDQAETVLGRLLRGTGVQGLRGIAPQRPLTPEVTLVRPLLRITREQVIAFLDVLKQPFREDSSNADIRRTRNRIRHELLPLLAEHYNPAIVSLLAGLATQMDEVFADEEQAVDCLLAQAERPRAGDMLVLDARSLAAASRRHVRALFRRLWAREGWPVDAMTFEAWERVAGLAFGEQTALDLPDGVRAQRRREVVQLMRA